MDYREAFFKSALTPNQILELEREYENNKRKSIMRYVLIASLICVAVYALCGCNSNVHAQVPITVNSAPVVQSPKPKVTRTVTETVKTETPVPVYEIKTNIVSNTKTVDSTGANVAPLHTATINGQLQEPTK